MVRMHRLSALIAFLGISSSAWAYIPPSEFITKMMVQKRHGLKTAKIRGRVLGLNVAGAPSGVQFTEETTYDASSGQVRCVALDEQGRELFRMERFVRKEQQGVDVAQMVSELQFETRPATLIGELKRWEIPIKTEEELLKLQDEAERRAAEKTFFARQKLPTGLQVSWVIGEKSGNQVWIEKETFLPVKFISLGAAGSEKTEITFDTFKMSREIPFARVVSLSRDQRHVLREEVQEVSVNLPEHAADRGADRAVERPEGQKSAAFGFTDLGNSASSDVRELIRAYTKWVR